MKRRILALLAVLALAVSLAAVADAGRVPPGATPTKACTRPPLPGTLNHITLCADPAATTVGTNVLVTVAPTINGAPITTGTPIFLYSDGALLTSCYAYGGGCAFVLNRSTPASNTLHAYAEGVWSAGLVVTWS